MVVADINDLHYIMGRQIDFERVINDTLQIRKIDTIHWSKRGIVRRM